MNDDRTFADDAEEKSARELLRVAESGSDCEKYRLAGIPVLPVSVVKALGRSADPMVRIQLVTSARNQFADALSETEVCERVPSVLQFLAEQHFASAAIKQTTYFRVLSPESIELAI